MQVRPIQINYTGSGSAHEVYSHTLKSLTEMIQFASLELNQDGLHGLYNQLTELAAIVANREAHAAYPGLEKADKEGAERPPNLYDKKPWTVTHRGGQHEID